MRSASQQGSNNLDKIHPQRIRSKSSIINNKPTTTYSYNLSTKPQTKHTVSTTKAMAKVDSSINIASLKANSFNIHLILGSISIPI